MQASLFKQASHPSLTVSVGSESHLPNNNSSCSFFMYPYDANTIRKMHSSLS